MIKSRDEYLRKEKQDHEEQSFADEYFAVKTEYCHFVNKNKFTLPESKKE